MAVCAIGSVIAFCLLGWHDVTSTDGGFNCGSLFAPNPRPPFIIDGKDYGIGGNCGAFTWDAQRPWLIASVILAFVLGTASIVFRKAKVRPAAA